MSSSVTSTLCVLQDRRALQECNNYEPRGLHSICASTARAYGLTTESCCYIHQNKNGESKRCCNSLHPCGRKQTVLRSCCISSTIHSVISHLNMLWTADPLQGLQKLCGQWPDSLVDPPEESVESEVSVVEQPKMTEPTARYKNNRVQRYSAQQACTATTQSATPKYIQMRLASQTDFCI